MKSEIYKRINTGLILFSLLIFMFISKTIYLFFSICIFSLSFIEFTKLSKLFLKKKKFKQFIINSAFATYIFLFLLIFIYGLSDIHFKIILFIVLLICISSDIGGILFGKIFKGPKLTRISPNKTISGSLGSFIFSMLTSSILLGYIFNTELLNNILLGFFVSLSVQLGDLFFSYLKRKASLKNTGNILPGHGGILDRIDGILLGIPVGLVYISILVFTG
tara:strand:+ start:621 stop:1280 length:660 start_codon:yes stop_codon:yes gene_type:complete